MPWWGIGSPFSSSMRLKDETFMVILSCREDIGNLVKLLVHRKGRHLLISAGAFFCIILIIAGCKDRIYAMDIDGSKATPKTVGGHCEYRVYKGYARITSIQKQEHRQVGHGGVSYECYEVRFFFHTNKKIEESFAQFEGRTFTLLLRNGWYPGAEFLKKYRIKVGGSFDCNMNVITKGSCTPIIFEFPTIDLSDYKTEST